MKPFRLLLLLAASVVMAGSVSAQPTRPAARVTFFSQTDFTGERITLRAGEKIDDFNHLRFPSGRSAQNRVSSILIEGDVEVSLFDYRAFRGEEITVRRSIANLHALPMANGYENWNNALSSVAVRERPGRGHVAGDRDRDHHRNRGEVDARRPDDRETIAVVRRAYLDILGREPDASGLKNYVGILQDRGWSPERLRQELRKSDEYRKIVVPREVSTAYREVLKREPDPSGLQFYTGRMINADWTVTRVRDALRRSPEYQATQRG